MIRITNNRLLKMVQYLHKSNSLRKFAKYCLSSFPIRQKFHGGLIYCDAVDHSWAWVHGPLYEKFDRELQDILLELSKRHDLLIDIGANVGAMTLSVLLRNDDIDAICIDPNGKALKMLRKSLRRNEIGHRAKTIEAAAVCDGSDVFFDFNGSVTGHIVSEGEKVKTIQFTQLLNESADNRHVLVKVDIEGFEVELFKCLNDVSHLQNITLVVELHPAGMNEIADPKYCLEKLLQSGAVVKDLAGNAICCVDESEFTQVVAAWV